MNGKLLISLFAGLLLTGCAGNAMAQDVVCPPIEIKDKKCTGDRHYPVVRIYTEKKEIKPEFICATLESVIEFRVLPPGKTAVGAVAVKAKDATNTWLVGTNYPQKKKIDILVPEWVTRDKEYGYNIFFEDGSCVDPRIHVE